MAPYEHSCTSGSILLCYFSRYDALLSSGHFSASIAIIDALGYYRIVHISTHVIYLYPSVFLTYHTKLISFGLLTGIILSSLQWAV